MLDCIYHGRWEIMVLREDVFPWELKAVLPRAGVEAEGVPFLWSLTTTFSSNIRCSLCLNHIDLHAGIFQHEEEK